MHDIVVIGGGPAGYGVAFRGAARGLDVAMIEADRIGGTCLNRGCIPSKTILHVAEVIEEIQRGEQLGLDVTFNGLNGDGLDAFRNDVMDTMRKGLLGLAKQRNTYIEGRARIVEGRGATKVVEVTDADGNTERVEGRNVVIATGSEPKMLPFAEADGEVVMTSDQAIRFTDAPERAVIIGAGAIGMEFASMWQPMGAEVTVIEALPRVLPLEDEDSSKTVQRAFRRKNIETLTDASVKDIESSGGTGRVSVEVDGEVREIEADLVLVAVGRGPNSAGVGAEEHGVLDDRGYVEADEYGRTSVEGVWAAGDVRPTLALAHAGFAEGWVIADLVAGEANVQPVDYAQVPRVTYCHPEVASIGLTESEARDRYGDDGIVVTKSNLKGNAKGLIHGLDGFVKVIHRSGRFGETVGVHIVGPHATDLIAEAALVTSWGALPSEVAAVVHAHPTLYELIGETFMSAAGVPFHTH